MITRSQVIDEIIFNLLEDIMGYKSGTLESLGWKSITKSIRFTNAVGNLDSVMVTVSVKFKKGNDFYSLNEVGEKFEAECIRYTKLFLRIKYYLEEGDLEIYKEDKELFLPVCKVKKYRRGFMFFPALDEETPGQVLYLVVKIN